MTSRDTRSRHPGLDSIAVEPGINARQALSPILAAVAGVAERGRDRDDRDQGGQHRHDPDHGDHRQRRQPHHGHPGAADLTGGDGCSRERISAHCISRRPTSRPRRSEGLCPSRRRRRRRPGIGTGTPSPRSSRPWSDRGVRRRRLRDDGGTGLPRRRPRPDRRPLPRRLGRGGRRRPDLQRPPRLLHAHPRLSGRGPGECYQQLDRLTSVVQDALDGSDLGGGCLPALTKLRRGGLDPSARHPERRMISRASSLT